MRHDPLIGLPQVLLIMRSIRTLPLLMLCLLVLPVPLAAAIQAAPPTGTIKGVVTHAGTGQPLAAANVIVLDTSMGGMTNAQGEYVIPGVPMGTWRLRIQFMGYEPVVKPDVIVRPGRATVADAAMRETVLSSEQIIEVSSGYYSEDPAYPTGRVALNPEEIRRSPGAAGDVSRILHSLPSVSRAADNANDLMVRGGSPAENGFFVDGIPVPNINHFPSQGGTGGPIGFLNTDLIRDVDYSAGGFGAEYGERLSAAVDIALREGSRDGIVGQADLHFAGLGGIVEGPLAGGEGSWLLAARRSYLDGILALFDQAGGLPVYGDVHAKAVLDLSPRHRLTLLDLFGYSGQDYGRQEGIDAGLPAYGSNHTWQNTVGLSWRALWAREGFSVTSLSLSSVDGDAATWRTSTTEEVYANDFRESALHLLSDHHWEPSPAHRGRFGLHLSAERAENDAIFGAGTDRLGDPVPRRAVRSNLDYLTGSGYLAWTWLPASPLALTGGVRVWWSGLGKRTAVDPRMSLEVRAGRRLSFGLSGGSYRQPLPLFLVMQDEANTALRDPRARHLVAGLEYLLTAETRLTLEVYEKRYDRLPMTAADRSLFILDHGNSLERFGSYTGMVDSGTALARGVELLIQKKLAVDFYGMIGLAYARSRYRDLDGAWRDRAFDSRLLGSVIGGYKPDARWEFSARFSWSGGRPYTPFDQAASEAAGTGIIDQSRIHGARYPVYHALDLRVDRRIHFRDSSLVCYLSLWNVYDRRNIEQYYWNEVSNTRDAMLQWSLLPIIGLEWEF